MSLRELLLECQSVYKDGGISESEYRDMRARLLESYAGKVMAPEAHGASANLTEVMAYMAEQGEATIYPWKVPMRSAQLARQSWEAHAQEASVFTFHRQKFNHLARGGQLLPIEVILGLALLYPKDDCPWRGIHEACCTLYQTPSQQRLAMHNWEIVRTMTVFDQHRWGPLVEYLPYPLFPQNELADLNEKVYAAAVAPYLGGSPGCDEDPFSKIYNLKNEATTYMGGSSASFKRDARLTETQNALRQYTHRVFSMPLAVDGQPLYRGGEKDATKPVAKNANPPLLQ